MNCTISGVIPVSNLRYNLSSGIDYSSKTYIPATGGFTDYEFNLLKQNGSNATQPSTKELYWGLGIPGAGAEGECNGKMLFTAFKNT